MSDHRDQGSPEAPLEDSEVDFDDEREDDQLPLDETEASELGLDLDDPEELSESEDDV